MKRRGEYGTDGNNGTDGKGLPGTFSVCSVISVCSVFSFSSPGLLILAAASLIVFGAACSGRKPNNPQSNTTAVSSNVTETTKNPLADLNEAAAAGKTLYAVNCASCHGDDGKGEGDFAASLPAIPSDLIADDVVSAADGKIFLVIRDGKMKDGKVTMAPARGVTDEQIWQIVSYIRALSEHKAGNKKED